MACMDTHTRALLAGGVREQGSDQIIEDALMVKSRGNLIIPNSQNVTKFFDCMWVYSALTEGHGRSVVDITPRFN